MNLILSDAVAAFPEQEDEVAAFPEQDVDAPVMLMPHVPDALPPVKVGE
jgi:hypothetical protein